MSETLTILRRHHTLKGILVFCCFMVAGVNDTLAQNLQIYGGGSIDAFQFEEFDDYGHSLLVEKGNIPGLFVGFDRTHNSWLLGGKFSVQNSQVNYEGQTTTGTSVSTHTNEKIMDVWLRTGHRFQGVKNSLWDVYLGSGYRHWKRDILGTQVASGLLEYYTTWYGFLGGQLHYPFSKKLQGGLDLQLTRTIRPKVDVELNLPNNAPVQLELKEKMGVHVSLPLRWQWSKNLWIATEPYYELWRFGRSKTKRLLIDDHYVGTIYEPRSTMQNRGFRISIIWEFF